MGALPLIIALLLVPTVYAEPTSPVNLSFEVFTDGVVRVEYNLNVDPTQAQVNISLFGENLNDLFVYDEEGVPLDVAQTQDGYQINTLGASSIEISYLTPDLTGKNGAIWTIEVYTPISSEVTLPLSSTIINLNEIPLEIQTVDDQTKIVMPEGDTMISYIVDIQDSEQLAEKEIESLEAEIGQAKTLGVVVTTAESLLDEAKTALESEDYLTAQEKAAEASLIVKEQVQLEGEASEQIADARDSIDTAQMAGRTLGLTVAEGLLDEAQALYDAGDYAASLEKTQQVYQAALAAEAPANNDNTLLYALVGAVILVGAYMLLRGRKTEPAPKYEEITIELELLFSEHPELRVDDREALRFMAEHGGEAFAHEIRERLGIPRTSAWRMVQRLQRYEVVEEKKIGGQSLISIVERYRRGST